MLRFAVFRRFISSTSNVNPKSVWVKYSDLLARRPVATKAITGGVIGASADLTCQLVFENANGEFDVVRFLKFSFLGTFLVAPTLHYWYGFLGRVLPGTSFSMTVQRLFFDQLVFSPSFLCLFMSSVLVLDGTPELIPSKISKEFVPTMLMNYTVWVPAMYVNFKFVPLQFQTLFSNVVGYFWNVYLSYVTHNTHESASITDNDE